MASHIRAARHRRSSWARASRSLDPRCEPGSRQAVREGTAGRTAHCPRVPSSRTPATFATPRVDLWSVSSPYRPAVPKDQGFDPARGGDGRSPVKAPTEPVLTPLTDSERGPCHVGTSNPDSAAAPRRPLPLDAYTRHAPGVTAFTRQRAPGAVRAIRSSHALRLCTVGDTASDRGCPYLVDERAKAIISSAAERQNVRIPATSSAVAGRSLIAGTGGSGALDASRHDGYRTHTLRGSRCCLVAHAGWTHTAADQPRP